jgi:hypothetical protein
MSVLKLAVGLVFLCWLAVAAFFYFSQGSLLYQPPPLDTAAETQLMNSQAGMQVFLVNTPDGQTLTGWFLPRQRGRGLAPALVYFGGNAEDATAFMSLSSQYPEVSLVAVNYRGYGHSTGVPGEKTLMDDSLAVYDQAVAATGGQALVMGRSLGSGLAAHVAANRPVLGAVLVTPYDSILNVARDHYPFLPVAWLLKDRFDILDDARRTEAPLLALTASQDDVIPEARAKALYDAWSGPKQLVNVPMAGHNDIVTYGSYAAAIQGFIKDRLR